MLRTAEKMMLDIAGLARKRTYLVQFAASIAQVLEIQKLTSTTEHYNMLTNDDLRTIKGLLERIDVSMGEIEIYMEYLTAGQPGIF